MVYKIFISLKISINAFSNLLTIVIMLVIKNYVIDEDKIHAQIEENKKRPEKAKSKFRQKIDAAMKQAQEQQALQKRKK